MTSERMSEILQESGEDQVSIQGAEVWCCCPLPGHDETKPSFSINVEKGVYNCFVCGGGSLRSLLASWGLDEEVLYTREREGLRGRLDAIRRRPAPVCAPRIQVANQDRFGKISKVAGAYLESRGFFPETIVSMAHTWDLWSSRRFGTEFLHFPVRDSLSGEVLFTVSRTLRHKSYRYTKGAKKSEALYGAHLLPFHSSPMRNEFAGYGRLGVVVVEGVFDMLKVWSFGFNAVALLGARPSQTQLDLLVKCDEVVWALDNDVAGMAGVSHGYRSLRGAGVQQRVLYLAGLKDPGEIPDRGAFEKAMLVRNSIPGRRGLSARLQNLRGAA